MPGRKPYRWTDAADDETIREMTADGETDEAIGEVLGRTRWSVAGRRRWLMKRKCRAAVSDRQRLRKPMGKPVDVERRAFVLTLLEKVKDGKALAAVLGVSKSAVSYLMRRMRRDGLVKLVGRGRYRPAESCGVA